MTDYCKDNPSFDTAEGDMDISVTSSVDGLHSSVDDETTLPSHRSDFPSPRRRAPGAKRRTFQDDYYKRSQRYNIVKNVILLSIAFLLNFTAFQSMQSLQSSLNRVEGLGTICLSVIYGCLMISCLFLPSILIKMLGCKKTITVCFIPYILFMAANLYADWFTMIPASVLVGLAAAPLWAAKCTYLTEMGKRYAEVSMLSEDAAINRFFGMFFMAFQSALIWGSLMSSFILQKAPTDGSWFSEVSDVQIAKCGVLYCPDTDVKDNTNLDRPETIKVYTLCGTFIGFGILAALTVGLLVEKQPGRSRRSPLHQLTTASKVIANRAWGTSLDSLNDFDSSQNFRNSTYEEPVCCRCPSWCGLLVATTKHLRFPAQILLIPVTVYSGLQQAFLAADFTKTYVSCSLGVWMIGLIFVCYGTFNAIFSLMWGRVARYSERVPIVVIGAAVHCGCFLALFMWRPHPDQLYVFFIIAAFWGVADAVWQTQLNALYGCIFSDTTEAAFANYRLWESAGFIIAFGYSNYLCVYNKLFILLGSLIVAVIGYFIVEGLEGRKTGEVMHDGYGN